ncbi:MAG TPA: glycosyltransferase family 2 protein [Acidimicrobiales bacterium]
MLSVVMPAHNEEAFLAPAVREVVEALRGRGDTFEVVVVENGSTDGTPAIARQLEAEVPEVRAISLSGADYGGALRTGFLEANGDLVAIFDVDYYDFEFLDHAVSVLNQPDGPDVVVGSKRGAGAVDTRAWARRTVTAVFSVILSVGFGLKVADTHGIKVVRRAPLKELAASCRYGTDIFDTELILRAERAGLRVTAIPVTVEERRPSRSSIVTRIPRTVLALARLRLALWRERKPR